MDAHAYLLQIAFAAGGEAGARLAKGAGLPTSPDTLLRLLRHASLPALGTPRVLGIDDLALRRRQVYATIFVDLETSCVVDLVEGRETETVANWLKAHPGVEVIARDRAEAYARGARAGAPNAIQVADRFHLLQNASAALDELLRSRRRALEQSIEVQVTSVAAAKAVPQIGMPAEIAPTLSPTKQQELERRAARVARWQKVKDLRQAGHNIKQIARALGMNRRTVRLYLATPEPPDNQVKHPRPSGLTSPTLQPYVGYLQDHWQDGCHNISQLYREIVAQGYKGSRSLLAQALCPWRPPKLSKRERRLRRRVNLRWLCLRSPEQLKPEERAALQEFLSQNPDLARGYALLQGFRQVLSNRDSLALTRWLTDAKDSGLSTFVGLANGVEGDREAVEAALRLPWSNGPVEGQINRVKLIKRQGYGRTKLDLLRARVLAA